jgi:hypothetical protein
MNHTAHAFGWRDSKTSLFWLALLIISNIAFGWSRWSSPQSAIAAMAPESLSTIRLISELSPSERVALEAARKKPETVAGAAPSAIAELVDPLVCQIWGPFSDERAMAPLQEQVAGVGSAMEVRASQISSDLDYQVYIDTGGSVDNARRTLKELKSQSVDAFVMTGGEFKNSVSVGVFSQTRSAEMQRKQVAALGYKVTVQTLNRPQTVYHLVARVPQSFTSVAAPVAPCATIASAQEFL